MRKFLTLIIFFNLLIINNLFAKEIEYLLFKSSNYEKPLKWYNSEEYKPIKQIRVDNSIGTNIIIKGI